jgi:murein DD-endopeptidase MepM/ murein hydrolase activator NlpD
MRRRFSLLLTVVVLPFALWAALPVGSSADQSPGQIQKQIDRKQSLIGGHKAHERVLTTDISRYTSKIDGLQGDIDRLSARQVKLQASLDAKNAELNTVQGKLRAERARLARLKARLLVVQRTLAQRLVAQYEDGGPDLINVVLSAQDFSDLLERAEFLHRISRQDAHIMDVVRTAKTQSTASEASLTTLEAKASKVAAQAAAARNQVAGVRDTLVDRRNSIQSVRAQKTRLLKSSRDRRQKLEDDVASLVKAQAKIQAKLAGIKLGDLGPVKQGSHGLIWPVNGPITSPFCESRAWESCHPGIDIGVPSGTPIRAAAAGKVVLMQNEASSGGYGNFTCIQHTAVLSTCYAHQSRFATSMGATVAQGQVIGYSGCTGRCFGPHVHFETRINGRVVNPMNYL